MIRTKRDEADARRRGPALRLGVARADVTVGVGLP